MQIHRVRGRSLREALQKARKAFGEDAVVINHESDRDGAVTIALAPQQETVKRAPSTDQRFEREVARRLQRNGASRDLIDRVAELFEQTFASDSSRPATVEHVIDWAAEAVGGMFKIATSPRLRGATRCVAFTGFTGVGKTTSLTKLAVRMVRAKRRIGIATFDTQRAVALEGLRSNCEMLGVPLFPFLDTQEAVHDKLQNSGLEAVLIDTTGNAEFDRNVLRWLGEALSGNGSELDTYMVLAATSSRATQEAARSAFEELKPKGCVITKLDETRESVAVLERVLGWDMAIAFLTDGPRIESHFHRAAPGHFADLLLRGRIA